MSNQEREVRWNKGAERDYGKEFSSTLQDKVDVALLEIAAGDAPSDPKIDISPHGHPFGNDVWKLKIKDRAGTYRVVYFKKYDEAIYVVNAYQKKSHKASEEPQEKVSATEERLKWAEREHAAWVKEQAEKARKEGNQ